MPLMCLRQPYQEDLNRLETKIAAKNLEEFQQKKHFTSMEHIQAVYNALAEHFVTQPIQLTKFIRRDVMTFKN